MVGGGVIVGKLESIYRLFFSANFIVDIVVYTCIKLLLKLTYCAHIKWQVTKNYKESILLNWRNFQSFSVK